MDKNEILQEIEKLNYGLFKGCSHSKDNTKIDLFPERENKPERTFSFEINYSLLKRELDKLDIDSRNAIVKEIVDESFLYEYMKISNGDREEEIARYKDYIKKLRYDYPGSYEIKDQNQTVESVSIPEELDTPEARKIFDKAIDAGLIKRSDKLNAVYMWLDEKQLLAYFAEKMSLRFNLGKIRNGKQTINWIIFQSIFNVPKIKGAKYDDMKDKFKFSPPGYEIVDKLFE